MSDARQRPIAERIEWLFDRASRHGQAYRSTEATLARSRYLSRHTTALVALKCMDGRTNIPVATQTPTGIVMPFPSEGAPDLTSTSKPVLITRGKCADK